MGLTSRKVRKEYRPVLGMVTTWNLSVRPTCDASNQVLVSKRIRRRTINVGPVALFGAFDGDFPAVSNFFATVHNACRGRAAAGCFFA